MVIYRGNIIQIEDISKILAHHERKKYRIIKNRLVENIIWHHTAGRIAHHGRSGPAAAAVWHVDGRGWPGLGYHFYIPYNPIESNGCSVIYQCNHLDAVSYHTRGCNRHGIGVVCQGYFHSRHFPNAKPPDGSGQPSAAQLIASQALWNYLHRLYPDAQITGHFEHGKKSCPGDTLESFVLEMGRGSVLV